MDAVRNLEVTFRSLGGGSKEKMQEDWESRSVERDRKSADRKKNCCGRRDLARLCDPSQRVSKTAASITDRVTMTARHRQSSDV